LRTARRTRRRAAALALLPAAALATALTIPTRAESAAQARIAADESVLVFGERFALGGAVPGDRGTGVRIKFRTAGAQQWRLLRTIHTDRHGRYRVGTRARHSGAYRAVPARGQASQPEAIAVRARSAFHTVKHNVLVGNGVRLHGRVRPGGSRRVKVVVSGPDGDVVRALSARDGSFALRWKPARTGSYRLRAYVGSNRLARSGRSVSRRVTVFRYAEASWYGPGLYGNRTACGKVLSSTILGVANKSLPCGAKVTLRYRGRSVTVPVIDRGPYAGNREYDLTEATKQRLGFGDTGTLLTNR
jgi:peptidoglycan lytic transglycosylase